jgi:hypothetical protein
VCERAHAHVLEAGAERAPLDVSHLAECITLDVIGFFNYDKDLGATQSKWVGGGGWGGGGMGAWVRATQSKWVGQERTRGVGWILWCAGGGPREWGPGAVCEGGSGAEECGAGCVLGGGAGQGQTHATTGPTLPTDSPQLVEVWCLVLIGPHTKQQPNRCVVLLPHVCCG